MPKLTQHEIRALAVAAECDPRTIRNYVRGEARTQGLSRLRIERALAAAGRTDLIRAEGDHAHAG